MPQVLYVSAHKADVMNMMRQLPSICAGDVPQYARFATAMAARVGNAFLANVKQSYVEKSESLGGYDDTRWTPNAVATVKRKVEKHVGNLRGKGARNQAFSQRYEEFKLLVSETKRSLRDAYVNSSDKDIRKQQVKALDRAVKAAVGDFAHVMRKETGFDNVRPFQLTAILRDTNRMFNSLSAGIADQPYAGIDAEYQIFRPEPGIITVGTNVVYASTHQHGDDERNIPARPFFPEPGSIPAEWWEDMFDAARSAIDVFIRTLGGAP
jgi:hypothetical protein